MNNYKTFKELKIGDPIWVVEMSRENCYFKKFKVKDFDYYQPSEDRIYTYIDSSPLSFDFPKNDSSWHGMLFTTKEEAIQSAKKQIGNEIRYHTNRVNWFTYMLQDIENIVFKETD